MTIRKLKLPDAIGEWGAYVVAEDEYGTWFFTPANSPIAWQRLEGKSAAWEFDVLCLIPPKDRWFGLWWGPSTHAVELSVDVTAPATRDGDTWSWLDLEIDLFRLKDGTVGVEDEDEFDESCAAGYITDEDRVESLRVTPVMQAMLRERTEPFGDVGRRHLDRAVALGLAPLEPPAS
ncbi:MAG: DUF402 domain-containing protein [Acidimicrobiales bacterium]|nr:DUF402 domain-containing protein [Acidimicrobiales bacterium]